MCFSPLCMAIPRMYVTLPVCITRLDYSVTFFSTDAHASPIRIIRGPMVDITCPLWCRKVDVLCRTYRQALSVLRAQNSMLYPATQNLRYANLFVCQGFQGCPHSVHTKKLSTPQGFLLPDTVPKLRESSTVAAPFT
jgi:hypothetical protein